MGLRHRAKRARRLSAAGQPHNATAISDWATVQQIRRAEGQNRTARHNATKAAAHVAPDDTRTITFAPPHRQRRRTGRG